ncbi:MAG: type pilus assembly protein PilM [Armatimonadetes bacterium]|jgi:type IV pilus assembly protein PilM|nr:type pilus assembly protein PilM [Armatimonadota bacterium]
MPLKKAGGPVVGLDIGTSFIKACEIDCKGGRASLRGIALLPTPAEAVTNNEITNPVALGKAIKQTLAQAGIKARKVVTSVAGQSSLVVRIIEVPKMTRAELQETMKWEIERHVPFAAEQVVMDYQPLVAPEDVPEGQNMEVLLAVAQEALVTRHVEAVQAAGLSPLAIDIEPLASSRSLLDLANGTGPTGTVAIIDLGASSTDVSIYKEGRIVFTRSIQLAGNTLTKAISDVLGQPLAEAERLKKEKAGIAEQPQAGNNADLLGGPGPLDFGMAEPDPLGAMLGGSFGMGGAAPGASTATDTQAEPAIDIAGGGFSPDLFTTPGEGTADPAPASGFAPAPFDLTSGSGPAPEVSPFGAPPALGGPVPMGNPFDPDAGAPVIPAPAPAPAANPFDGGGLFGSTPGADPFATAGVDYGGFGAPTAPTAGEPASLMPAMSEEDYVRTQIGDAIMPILHELVTELRRSLDFYRNRANGLGAQHVVVCGGTAKLPGLVDFLSSNLEVPVQVGNPLNHLTAGPKSDPGYLQNYGPFFSVAVGLAMRELMFDPPAAKAPKAPKAAKAPKPPKAPKAPKAKK